MSFRVPGKLIERNVRLGDAVKQGQVIAQLDPVDAQKQAVSAKAALDAAEHRLVYAQQQLDRDKAQSEANLIAANQLEQTQDSFTAALAGRDQAAAQLVVARNNLQYNTLVADHDGLITSESADTGQVVSAGQAVYGLAWIGDTDVILDAAESDLGRIAVGQAATITFPALPGRQYEAHVREMAPAADPQSRTYRVKLTMAGPPQDVRFGMTGDATLAPIDTPAPTTAATTSAAAHISAGLTSVATRNSAEFTRVATRNSTGSTTAAAHNGAGSTSATAPTTASLIPSTGTPPPGGNTLPQQQIYTLPATAIFHQDSGPAVWVITGSDSTLQLRPVKVSSYTDHTSVVTAGLNDGEVVVLAGVHTVYTGQHVKPVRPLFDGDGNIEGPAPASPPNVGAATAPAVATVAATAGPQ
jgi:RND family efflux transporter MFP subunit